MSKERPTLLLVDDNLGNCQLLRMLFDQEGYDVLLSSSGTEALQQLQQHRCDLVLLDVSMPDLDGFEVLKIIRQSHSPMDLPVIMATGSAHSNDVVTALQLGANDYVIKPFDFPVVHARVQTQLSLKRLMDQMRILERDLGQRNAELETANSRLSSAYQKMKRDLEAAAKIQRAFLPQTLPQTKGVRFAWKFYPCETLAGDTLNIVQLDEKHLGVYVLDVSGHGVAAALLSVTLSRILSPLPASSSILLESCDGPTGYRPSSPAAVLAALAERFPWDSTAEQFFSIIYGVLNVETGLFRYVSAGHPGVIHVSRDAAPVLYRVSSFPIGVPVRAEDHRYEEEAIQLRPGDRLYLYSDGVTEARSSSHELYGTSRLLSLLDQNRRASLEEISRTLTESLRQWCGGHGFKDDLSILAVEYLGQEQFRENAIGAALQKWSSPGRQNALQAATA